MKSGKLRILTVFIISVIIISYGAYTNFNKLINNKNIQAEQTISNVSYSSVSETKKVDNTSSTQEKAPETAVSSQKTDSESIATSTEAVKGKIINEFISPYTANNSYSNVYLKNSTDLTFDLKSLLESKLSFNIKKNNQPQVLIMHTHTTESYMSQDTDYYTEAYTSRNVDENKNMVLVGNIIADKLNKDGITTLHDTTKHDYPQYTGSYSRSAKTVCSYLEKYKSLKIVMDFHRDAVSSGTSDKVKFTTNINGKKAAQVMIVMGSQSGKVTNFPNWQENLKLATKLQKVLETNYPTLARPISLMPANYNESLTNGSILIEFGTDANNIEEAKYSAELVGNCLVELFNSLT